MSYMNYIGKGNPLVYWANSGRHFGFPECCIEAFLEGSLPATSHFDGTGYRPCKVCIQRDPEELVAEINRNRSHPTPFPNSSGFVEKYKDLMYSE